MLDLTQPHPLKAIVASVDAKTPLGSAMRTAEWERMPAGLRDAAFFSASVESTRFLQQAKDGIAEIVSRAREVNDQGQEYWKMDRSRLLADLRRLGESIGVPRPDGRENGKILEKDITDPLSIARLRLIINTQMEMAYGKADWLTGMDPDLLEAFPAWELVRISPRMVPRDWPARWKAAGGKLSEGGRMIAIKTDEIWKRLSRFANPYPPFDFNSGMGVEDVDRAEAEDLGLIGADDVLTPNVAAHQEALKASLSGLQSAQVAALQQRLKLTFKEVQVDAVKKVVTASPAAPKAPAAKRVSAQILADQAAAFSQQFGCDVIFATPRGKWGAKMTLTACSRHLETVTAEWQRVRAAFPNMPANPVKTFACVASRRGLAHVDGPAPQFSTKAAQNVWSPASWERIRQWESLKQRPWGTERPESQVEDNFRHELAHTLSAPAVLAEFRASVLARYDLEWIRRNVSQYGATKPTEALAELFGLLTRGDYVRGTLPAEVESFVFKFMLGES